MLGEEDYLLKEERLIGHELIVERTGLCRRRLNLENVYYNQLMSKVYRVVDFSLSDLLLSLECMKTLELVRTFNPSKGEINGLTETSRRINSLRSNFKNQYLEKAKEILKEKEREYKP